jgi:hypothetical protein
MAYIMLLLTSLIFRNKLKSEKHQGDFKGGFFIYLIYLFPDIGVSISNFPIKPNPP